LNAMTLSLARALAPAIRVNTVCPGYIDTPWFTKGRGEAGAKQVRDAVVARVPLTVASSAEDIAQLVCFLASPPSSTMTGECLRMDAGMHLILGRAGIARSEATKQSRASRGILDCFASLAMTRRRRCSG